MVQKRIIIKDSKFNFQIKYMVNLFKHLTIIMDYLNFKVLLMIKFIIINMVNLLNQLTTIMDFLNFKALFIIIVKSIIIINVIKQLIFNYSIDFKVLLNILVKLMFIIIKDFSYSYTVSTLNQDIISLLIIKLFFYQLFSMLTLMYLYYQKIICFFYLFNFLINLLRQIILVN